MWQTLVHRGPYVQPKYVKVENGPKLVFDGREIDVPAQVQQYLFLYCKYGGPKDDVFVENFFSSIWDLFPDAMQKKLDNWGSDKCDLSQFYEYLEEQSTQELSPEAKKEKKAKALAMKEYYSTCILDGVEQTIGGYAVEPASLFKGLGDNPNRGKIKLPVTPRDITINTSIPPKEFPKPPYDEWGAIVCDREKLYIASFRSNVTGKIKYIYLNRNSEFKVNSEIEKYEKARNLSLIIDDIREEYHSLLASADRRERELGLVLYLVDRYAFRIGNEPSTGSGAETTGATTLKHENVKLLKGNKVKFNFVAKDSIVYNETKRMDEDAYAVLAELLGGTLGGATPRYPPRCTKEEVEAAVPEKVLRAFCKEVDNVYCPADMEKPIGRLTKKEKELLQSLQEEDFMYHIEYYKGVPLPPKECSLTKMGGASKDQIFSISASSVNKWLEEKMTGLTAKVFRTYNASIMIQQELLDKNMSRFKEEKKLYEFARVNTEIALICNHKRTVPPEKLEKIDNAIKEIDEKEKPTERDVKKREKLLRDKLTIGVALGTSLMNYIDPRLVYTWCNKNEIDPSKIYPKATLEATSWASEETDFSYT